MYRECVVWALCAAAVLSQRTEDGSDFGNVFDQDLYESTLDPDRCKKHLSRMKTFEFYDASFRIPQGIMKGNFASMGNYHQCLAISQTLQDDVVRGKFCMVVVTPDAVMPFPILSGNTWLKDVNWNYVNIETTVKAVPNYQDLMAIGNRLQRQTKWVDSITIFEDIEFSLAMCIPETCTLRDALAPLNSSSVGFNYEEEFCRLPGDKPMAAADYIAIATFSIIGVLTVLSTALDVTHRFIFTKDQAEANDLLLCCSLYTNTKKLLTFRRTPSSIDCLYGVRAIALIWIIMGHTLIYFFSKYTANIVDLVNWAGAPEHAWVIAFAELSVDTFFVLSGLLLVYTSARKIKPSQFLRAVPALYARRLLRTTPLLAGAVLLQASLAHRAADGADWPYMAQFVRACRRHWRAALLHVQNITNPVELCVTPTWYLAVDWQLHALAPLLLRWLLRGRRAAGSALAAALAVLLLAAVGFVCFMDLTTGYNIEVYFYQNPLIRAPGFVVGMAIGYILHIYRDENLKLSTRMVCVGYAAAAGVAWGCARGLYAAQAGRRALQLGQLLARPGWALCVGWVVVACAHGYGGPINWFLSLRMWEFISRISYAMFLLHYPVLLIIGSSRVTSFYFTLQAFFVQLAGVLGGAGAAAAALTLLLDAPCAALLARTGRTKPVATTISVRRPPDSEAENNLTTTVR